MSSCREKRAIPERRRLEDFSGTSFTLNSHCSAWKELSYPGGDKGAARDLLLLGIAPGELEELPFVKETLMQGRKIYWLEAPETLEQLKKLKRRLPPSNPSWIHIEADYLQVSSLKERIFFYEPGRRLAPDYWGRIIADFDIKKNKGENPLDKALTSSLGWLPGNTSQLLHTELYEALRNNGIDRIISELPSVPDYQSLEKIWQKQIPDFILSVNFRGLDSEGHIFEICEALNIPLAIWLVDNPWHLLSGIRLPWWKRAHIFVSDEDFVLPLRNSGARHAAHCPLATASHMWRDSAKEGGKALFIGRSTFPAQKEFFGNMRVGEAMEKEVNAYLELNGHYPDYHWWENRFQERPWPGKGVRKAGFFADYFSARNRARWLEKAASVNIRIIGDAGWKEIIPGSVVENQVDYYGSLPEIYQNSGAVLNVTSLLLPGSLNQRHFDVWAAGSMLLTDAGRGLNIFPAELTSDIKLDVPEEFPVKFSFWQSHQNMRRELIQAWQKYLKEKHTYAHRIEYMRELTSKTVA